MAIHDTQQHSSIDSTKGFGAAITAILLIGIATTVFLHEVRREELRDFLAAIVRRQ